MKKPLYRRIVNRFLASLVRLAPGAYSLRPFIHKLRGVKINGRVFIGDDVYLENEHPEAIELNDGAQVCLRAIILAHTNGLGRVVIEKNAFIGTACVISASKGRTLRIGEGAVISASCVISTDVPDHALVGIPKPEILAKATIPLTDSISYDRFVMGLRPWKP